MLYEIRCNNPSFRTVQFEPGFNVILAERTLESTEKDSRNGLGKSTLVEIIHFCLGATTSTTSALSHDALDGWRFTIDLDLDGKKYSITRDTGNPKQVEIEGDTSNWPIRPMFNDSGKKVLTISYWNRLLGILAFNLPEVPSETNEYMPTFRSLVSYIVRRGRDAFSIPFEHFRKQAEWDKQVNSAYLLGLGWEYASEWQRLKDEEQTLQQLKRASRTGVVSQVIGTIGDLETQQVQLQEQIDQQQQRLLEFRVHPDYEEIAERANELTSLMHEWTNKSVRDRRMREYYEASYKEEINPNQEDVAAVYEEAGVIFPERLTKTLEEVRNFYQQVVANRKAFLEQEISRLTNAIREHETQARIADEERSALMNILSTHGALESYNLLQRRLSESIASLETVKAQIDTLKRIERGQSTLKIQRQQLQIRARADSDERKSIKQRAIQLFNQNSEALYEAPGKLIIDVGINGFKFQVEIERAASQGFEQMKVFCYDLMIAELWSQKSIKPGFLVHDSTIFDGVDERQFAHALELAFRASQEYKFQYICCLNSDTVPAKEFSANFDINQFIRIKLTDAHESGSLLGIRF